MSALRRKLRWSPYKNTHKNRARRDGTINSIRNHPNIKAIFTNPEVLQEFISSLSPDELSIISQNINNLSQLKLHVQDMQDDVDSSAKSLEIEG